MKVFWFGGILMHHGTSGNLDLGIGAAALRLHIDADRKKPSDECQSELVAGLDKTMSLGRVKSRGVLLSQAFWYLECLPPGHFTNSLAFCSVPQELHLSTRHGHLASFFWSG
jgi:hypothetical protein